MHSIIPRGIWQFRKYSWFIRTLPNFLLIGAQKSGTTSLYYFLSQHPHIRPSCLKEVHFFNGGMDPGIDCYDKGLKWYRSHFPINILRHNIKTFEATPGYIFNPLSPKRIFETFPEIKIIIMLRNPTERAISHFFHEKLAKREPLSILEAMKMEEKRLECIINDDDFKNIKFICYTYKSRGHYKIQIERYLKYFSFNQIMIVNSEEFFSETKRILRDVFEFVGVDPINMEYDLIPQNVSKNRTSVPPIVYEYLDTYFYPHNQELYKLVKRDFGW